MLICHLFMFFVEVYFKSFAHCSFISFLFLLSYFENSFFTLDMYPLSISCLQILSPRLWLVILAIDYHGPWQDFLYIFSACLLNIYYELWVHNFHQICKIWGTISSIFFCHSYISFIISWIFNYTYIKLFNIVL